MIAQRLDLKRLRQRPCRDQEVTHFKSEKQLSRIQSLRLCYAHLTEPVALFSIFPYIAEMIQRNEGLPVAYVGFNTGFVELFFSLTRVIVLVLLGNKVDRISRKKLLVCRTAGMAIGPALFGLATSVWQMILFRSLTGAFSGANFIFRTMIGEQCTKKTQAKAFSLYSVAGNLGIFFGPIIGGALAHPTVQYPSIFGLKELLERHPYALPGFVVGSLRPTAAISSLSLLQETLMKETSDADIEGSCKMRGSCRLPSPWELPKHPNILAAFGVYGYVMILAISFTAPTCCIVHASRNWRHGISTHRDHFLHGGDGCERDPLGHVLLPIPASSCGDQRCPAYLFFFEGYPLLNALNRHGGEFGYRLPLMVLSIHALIGPGTWMSLTAAQRAINEASPRPEVLGKLNSMAGICYSTIRTTIPGISTALFAVGERRQVFSGHLAWWTVCLFAFGFTFICKRLMAEPM